MGSTVGGVGGPLGRWARVGATWWTPLRVLLAMATFSYILGYVLDLSCRSEGWRSPERYEHLCYTDIAPLYTLRGFADGLLPYIQAMPDGQHLEYPVLTGGLMQIAALITAAVTGVFPTDSPATVFFDVNVVLLFIAFAVTVAATALTVRRRPWDAAMVALAPTMILAATINWDLLPLAFIALALLLWARRHPFAAGLLLGLAVAAKFYPVLFLGGFLVLTIRTAKWRAFGLLVAGTAASWLVVNVPFMLANFEGWSYFYRFSQTRGEDFGSIWFALSQAGLPSIPADRLNMIATGLFLLLCVGHRVGDAGGQAPAPTGERALPDHRRVRAHQQGVLAAVRAVAHPAGGHGPPAVARLPGLAGGPAGLLRRHLVVPRRLRTR